MEEVECVTCRKPKAPFQCGECSGAICKKCVQSLHHETFSFLKEIPENLKHTHYCGECHDQIVAPALERYNEIMERAKAAFIFFKTQRKEIPLIKKSQEVYRIPECLDRDETIMRMAFFAASEGYNAVIEVEALSKKLRNGAYQTSRWSGTGVGAMVDENKIELQDQRNAVYR